MRKIDAADILSAINPFDLKDKINDMVQNPRFFDDEMDMTQDGANELMDWIAEQLTDEEG